MSLPIICAQAVNEIGLKAYHDHKDDFCPKEMQLTCPVLSCNDEADLKNQGTCF